jgi:hypothetical protein
MRGHAAVAGILFKDFFVLTLMDIKVIIPID